MYIYKYKAEPQYKQIAKYELQTIFGAAIETELFVSEKSIDPTRSYFIKYKIEIMAQSTDIEQLVKRIANLNLDYQDFKIEFVEVKSDFMEYKTRIKYCQTIADSFKGNGKMIDPRVRFVVSYMNGTWYFGRQTRNETNFLRNKSKPHTYSHSVSTVLARSLVNIAAGNSRPKMIDPCCGVGTVVIEALELGYDIIGTEINYLVAENAKENLKALKLSPVVVKQDMHTITDDYDVAILDIPYGIMSKTSDELQLGLIAKCYEFSDKLILVACEDSVRLIEQTRWHIKAELFAPKDNNNFKRHIYILIKN